MEYGKEQDPHALALQLATLTAQLDRSVGQLQQQGGQSMRAMQTSAQTLAQQSQQLAGEVVQAVSQQTHGAMVHGLQQSLTPLHQATRDAGAVTTALAQQLSALRSAQQSLVWKAGLALIIGSVLVVGGCGWAVWKTQRALKQAEFPTQVLEATRSGAITVCGEALCVKAGSKPQHYGQNGDYVVVQPTASGGQ
ncbi:hypothetical protein [Pseudoxanthomonas dokdonensis]|nr:hypothetical protein [Pseudoxanthomonas dokdonensis]